MLQLLLVNDSLVRQLSFICWHLPQFWHGTYYLLVVHFKSQFKVGACAYVYVLACSESVLWSTFILLHLLTLVLIQSAVSL